MCSQVSAMLHVGGDALGLANPGQSDVVRDQVVFPKEDTRLLTEVQDKCPSALFSRRSCI